MGHLDQQRLWHICHGNRPEEQLRHAFGPRVVAVMDDCSVGPLADVDSPCQGQRTDFWCAQVSRRDAQRGRVRQVADMIAADRRELAQLDPGATEFVVWTCNDAAVQCLLRRALWWLSGHTASVSVASFDPAESLLNESGVSGPSSAARHHLLSRFLRRKTLALADREVLALQWLRLRDERSMLRVWADGHFQMALGQKLLLPEIQSRATVSPPT
jgi:hypothetical protein